MDYIIKGIAFMLIPIVISGIFNLSKYSKESKNGKAYIQGKVYNDKLLLIIGLIDLGIFLPFAFICVFNDSPTWVPVGFLAFSLLGAVLVVAFINCRISYDNDGFVYKNFFGISRKFTYDQVTAIKFNVHETYVYLGKSRVMVDGLAVGGLNFIKLVNKQYRKIHDGQNLPEIKAKRDIFNGNLNNPGEILFGCGVVSVLTIGMLILILYYTFAPCTEDNTIKQTVSFVSCSIEEDTMVLLSADDKTYKIYYPDSLSDSESIQEICGKAGGVTVYSKEVTPDDGESYYSVKAIQDGDNIILSFKETHRLHIRENIPVVVMVGIIFVLGQAIVVMMILIGRNPKRFSKRVVRFFFKDGYINYK